MKYCYGDLSSDIHINHGTRLEFAAHIHNHLEMVYMYEGQAKAIVDAQECIISTGDFFITFPYQIHQYLRIDDENYFIAIIPPELCPEFQQLFKSRIPVSAIIKEAGKNDILMQAVKGIVNAKQNQTIYRNTLLKGFFLVLLSELIPMMQLNEVKTTDFDTIKEALRYCEDNHGKDVCLETVARALHINKYHLSHLFSEKLRTRFDEHIGKLRIFDACKLIENEHINMLEVADRVGFESSRTFNRLFVKYVGTTPRQYKKQFLSRFYIDGSKPGE